ncbi:uncharacterized protein LOC118482287 isoform X1 [Helianthus annuus]|uniref:uncharacterized protein LOC118482287 isoform X1 n=1 Tax=Helianthus annuus TaxID=4232 RepID=UPI00165326AE|nr:uncharacterized protein LOC118482287 isoform X1 [Helianthus annuus]
MTVTRFILNIMTVISRSKSTDMTNYGFSSSLCSTSSLIQFNLLHQRGLIYHFYISKSLLIYFYLVTNLWYLSVVHQVAATFAVFLSGFVPIVVYLLKGRYWAIQETRRLSEHNL